MLNKQLLSWSVSVYLHKIYINYQNINLPGNGDHLQRQGPAEAESGTTRGEPKLDFLL